MSTTTIKVFHKLGTELLFTLLPFIVAAIVFSNAGKGTKLLYMSEWSLAASVLVGQGLVKYISGFLAAHNKFPLDWERGGFIITAVIVFGLAPSLVVLSLVLTGENPTSGAAETHSISLAIAQMVLFVLGLFIFLFLGGIGESARTE